MVASVEKGICHSRSITMYTYKSTLQEGVVASRNLDGKMLSMTPAILEIISIIAQQGLQLWTSFSILLRLLLSQLGLLCISTYQTLDMTRCDTLLPAKCYFMQLCHITHNIRFPVLNFLHFCPTRAELRYSILCMVLKRFSPCLPLRKRPNRNLIGGNSSYLIGKFLV